MAWKCQDNLKVMNDCLRLKYVPSMFTHPNILSRSMPLDLRVRADLSSCTQEILDAARIEYMQNREVKKQEALYKLKRKRLEDYAKAHKITVAEVELQLAYAEKLRTEALAKMNRES